MKHLKSFESHSQPLLSNETIQKIDKECNDAYDIAFQKVTDVDKHGDSYDARGTYFDMVLDIFKANIPNYDFTNAYEFIYDVISDDAVMISHMKDYLLDYIEEHPMYFSKN